MFVAGLMVLLIPIDGLNGHAGAPKPWTELHLQSLEDVSGSLSFDEVGGLEDRFEAVESNTLNAGFSTSAHWFRATLQRPEQTDRLLLQLAIFLHNAMLALSVKEPIYAHYALYVLSYSVFQMCLNGLAYQYLWPGSTLMAGKGTSIFMALSATLATLFSREILEIGSNQTSTRLCW